MIQHYDTIDSLDIIARIEYLANGERTGDEQDEYESLLALAAQGETLGDWIYGVTLVNDDYFIEYARELAEGCGLIDPDAAWPHTCIDWEWAAKELRMDYTPLDWGGVTYWAR